MEEITSFLTKGKSRLSLPDKTPVLDMLTSGDQVSMTLSIITGTMRQTISEMSFFCFKMSPESCTLMVLYTVNQIHFHNGQLCMKTQKWLFN